MKGQPLVKLCYKGLVREEDRREESSILPLLRREGKVLSSGFEERSRSTIRERGRNKGEGKKYSSLT